MSVNPIDAQVMVLNQANVGKEQQEAKEMAKTVVDTQSDKIQKESKENEEKVIEHDNSSEKQKISDKEQKENPNKKNKNKKKKKKEEEYVKEIEHQMDPVRGHILDIQT